MGNVQYLVCPDCNKRWPDDYDASHCDCGYPIDKMFLEPKLSAVSSFAGQIAKAIHDRWCCQHDDGSVIVFKRATTQQAKTGYRRRHWEPILTVTRERIEMILEMTYSERDAAFLKLVKRGRDVANKLPNAVQ